MNSIQLSYKIGNIDDALIIEAEKSTYIKRSSGWKKIVALAACIMLIISSVIAVPKLVKNFNNTLFPAEKIYLSVNDIPVKSSGTNYLAGYGGSGPVSLMELNGELYFTYITRWAGNDRTRDTVEYYTLFRYNTRDNSCTAISDEVGYISLLNDRFIYARTDICLTESNRWNADYYTNNAQWNDEVKISGEEARNIMSDQKHSAFIDGKMESYTVGTDNETISIFFNESGKTYVLIPDFSNIIQDNSDKRVNIDSIVGITNGKVYFSANYNKKTSSDYCWELLSINLDGTGLTLITSDKSTHIIGSGAFVGEDGFVYYHYRGDTSYILKVDPKTDETQIIATVNAYVWTWVTNGEYILCQIKGTRPYQPSELMLIKIK